MREQDTIALACVIDALVASIDPTGGVTARMCDALVRGLAIAEEAGQDSEAVEIVRKVLERSCQSLTTLTEKAARNQRGRPFEKGKSGNPSGKPKGARHKITQLAEKLMQDDAENIVNAVLTAARLVLDRIAPARRDNPVRFELPELGTAAEAAKAIGALVAAVAAGELTPIIGEAFTQPERFS